MFNIPLHRKNKLNEKIQEQQHQGQIEEELQVSGYSQSGEA
jgi:hypothetical protein